MSRDLDLRVREAENQTRIAKLMARRFWTILCNRVDRASAMLFENDLTADAQRVTDVVFDAAEIVWERHHIFVEPCRRILDGVLGFSFTGGAVQPEMYIGSWPNGDTRNLTRDQLLMMAGMDVEDAA